MKGNFRSIIVHKISFIKSIWKSVFTEQYDTNVRFHFIRKVFRTNESKNNDLEILLI